MNLSPVETTTPIQMTEEKIEITINQNQGLYNKPLNKKPNGDGIVIEHHHHLNYHPKSKIKTKSLNDPNYLTNKLDNRLTNNSSIRTTKDQHKNNRNRTNGSKSISKSKMDHDFKKTNSEPISELKTESSNQFEPLDSEGKLNDDQSNKEIPERTYSTNIVIDGLPGFPDPTLYESTITRTLIKNKTDQRLEIDDGIELAADGAGFVIGEIGKDNFETTNEKIETEQISKASSDRTNYKESTDNNKMNMIQNKPIKEQIKVSKERFVVKEPSVIWATESDESAEEEEIGSKLAKIDKSIQSVFYRRDLKKQSENKQYGADNLSASLNNKNSRLHLTNSNSPSINFVETVAAESNQLNKQILVQMMQNGNLHHPKILKSNFVNSPKFATPQLPLQHKKSNFNLRERQYSNNPTFRLQTRNKRDLNLDENKINTKSDTKNDARTDVKTDKNKIYRIFSFNQQEQPINLIKNSRTDLETSSNVNVERNKPLKTSNYNYNNMNLYNPNEADDKVKELDKSKELGNSGEKNEFNKQQQNLKKVKPKKRIRPIKPMRQPNFIDDNPFINLFNTLTTLGQNSLSQAMGQNNMNSNRNYQRVANEDESSDDEEIDNNLVSTEKPKYGILGSGN